MCKSKEMREGKRRTMGMGNMTRSAASRPYTKTRDNKTVKYGRFRRSPTCIETTSGGWTRGKTSSFRLEKEVDAQFYF